MSEMACLMGGVEPAFPVQECEEREGRGGKRERVTFPNQHVMLSDDVSFQRV